MSKENSMDNFFRNTNQEKIESLSDKSTDAKSETSIPKGLVQSKVYGDYYDVSNTITVASSADPNDFDSAVYNRERIFEVLERNAERLLVKNDGSDILYVVSTHIGGLSFSREVPIYPGEAKIYYNIYELRLRSSTEGLTYRVTEYNICCNSILGIYTVVPSTNSIIKGTKIDISNIAAQITVASTPIFKVVTVKVRSLGTGTYIAIGDSTSQPFRLNAVGDSHDIDWTDNLNKIYVLTDNGNTGALEYIGG